MTSSRDTILGKIRKARRLVTADADTESAQRLRDHPRNLVPARGDLEVEDRIALFVSEAERVEATTARVAGAAEAVRETARYLKAANLPPRLRRSDALAGLPWSAEAMLDVVTGAAAPEDTASITLAFAGVAETGTLISLSGPENPTTLNFLPPTAIAVVSRDRIVGSYEEVWSDLRRRNREGDDQDDDFMPRTVNMITGPSRTADIEQTLLLGAHGPQRLHIIIVDEEISS